MVGAFVVAPAQVDAQLLGRDVGDRVVERLHVQLRALAELGDREVGVLDVPAHAEVGAVELQHQPALGHGLVLVAHGLGDGIDVGLEVLVVIVAEEQRHHARRGRAHEASAGTDALHRRLEVGDVRHRRVPVAHADRPVAGRRLAPRAAGIAEHAPLEPRELGEVLVDERVAGAAEAREPVLDVGGVARLRHLAVVDEVDAGLDLLPHDLGHRLAHALAECGRLDRHALLLGVHGADEIVGPRQGAGMRGQKALRAALHVLVLPGQNLPYRAG